MPLESRVPRPAQRGRIIALLRGKSIKLEVAQGHLSTALKNTSKAGKVAPCELFCTCGEGVKGQVYVGAKSDKSVITHAAVVEFFYNHLEAELRKILPQGWDVGVAA